MTTTIKTLAMLLLVAGIQANVAAASWTKDTIPRPIPTAYGFGESVALSRDGNTALVAAPVEFCSATVTWCGAAYVYVKDAAGWRLQAKLRPSDIVAFRSFGGDDYDDHTIDLSADGNTAIIGVDPGSYGGGYPSTPFTSAPKGAVYIFVRNGETWTEQTKLVRPDASGNGFDGFGRSVALANDGNSAVVGDGLSNYSFYAPIPSGAYVFTRTGTAWNLQARLGSATQSQYFGHAVDISGDGGTVAVGDIAQAYIFRKRNGTWREQAVLKAADKQVIYYNDTDFSQSIALSGSGDTALINRYIFQFDSLKGGWREEAKLGSNITRFSRFGFTVDIDTSGQQAVVGDWGAGAIYIYHPEIDVKTGFVKWLPERLVAQGSSVGISGDGNTILTGYGVNVFTRQP